MTHWADKYVGLPAEGRRPCWLLVRKVWADRLGFEMPRYDELQNPEFAIRTGEKTFREVPKNQAQEFDAVVMSIPARSRSGKFVPLEAHIGVVVSAGLVLHVEEGGRSMIEPIKSLHVSRVMRGPWGAE